MGKKKAESNKKIRIRQVRSIIGGTERQRAILRSLGLKKMNQEVVQPANPAILGMIRSIPHLLEVSEEK
ncbi:50S ribosomal protein L30 [bacterium]|jgi:large subunit ribosomal protein L30|nr:50S ribosomal protein L30 [bacterium]MCI0611362.1 50S ribosomal protein L30 [bacterium]